jgi:hypothetical protein
MGLVTVKREELTCLVEAERHYSYTRRSTPASPNRKGTSG